VQRGTTQKGKGKKLGIIKGDKEERKGKLKAP